MFNSGEQIYENLFIIGPFSVSDYHPFRLPERCPENKIQIVDVSLELIMRATGKQKNLYLQLEKGSNRSSSFSDPKSFNYNIN